MKKLLTFLLALFITSAATISTYAAGIEPPYVEPPQPHVIASTGTVQAISDIGNSSVVPKIEIHTEDNNGAQLEKADGYVNAQISITDTDGSVLSDSVLFKVRGNSTAMTFVDKKAFTFKFEKKTNVLGMGKGKKWAMLANCFDPTLLRNYLVFDFAKELGLPYTSEQRFTELWLDGAYRGCYTVYEPVQEGKDRVDIDIESNDGKKDFLLEYEASRTEDDVTYINVSGLRFAISEPDPPSDEQTAYISGVMTDILNTVRYGSEADVREKIDVDSFAKFYLLNEYAKTGDFGLSSVFFFYKEGVLYAGPPWDYDLALGNLNGNLNSTSAKQGSVPDGIMQADKNIYRYLCNKDWFMQEVKRVYAEHYSYIENISADGGILDTMRAANSALFARNFTVWKVSRWWLNYQRTPLATYDDNYNLLKNWCADRNSWLTNYYGLYRLDYLRGDADGNGKVEIYDITLIQSILAHMREDTGGDVALRAALTNKNLQISDVTYIQRFLARMENPQRINETENIMRY